MTRIKGIFHEDLCTFTLTSRSVLLRMKVVPEKVTEKIESHFYAH